MNAFIAHFAFEFRTGIRNKNLLLLFYLFPLGFYAMMGLIMTGINPLFRDTMVPAMAAFAVLAATLLGLPDPLVSARESGIFRSYKINGVPLSSILSIPALSTALHLILVAAIISFTAPIFFDAVAPTDWVTYVVVFLAFLVACTGLGVLIGVVSPNTRMTVLYSQAVFLPSMLIGGLMLPYDMLPEAAQLFAQLSPATHAMNAFNGLAMGYEAAFSPWGSVILMLISGVLGFALAWYLFSWDSRNSERRGHPLLGFLVLLPYVIGIFIL